MKPIESWTVSPDDMQDLKNLVTSLSPVTGFSELGPVAYKIAAIGMAREVGTQNDEIARFLFNGETGQVLDRTLLRSSLIRVGDEVGVRIFTSETSKVDIRSPGVRSLIHPVFSFVQSPEERFAESLVIFPSTVYHFLKSQEIEPVIVKTWALNTIFGGFHPNMNYYQTNLWELTNFDAKVFSELVAKKQIPFLGTHDFIAHIAGSDGQRWGALQLRGQELHELLVDTYGDVLSPSLASLILPFVAGLLLDDLAQPPSYDDETRLIPLRLVSNAIKERRIAPEKRRVLTKFPDHYTKLVDLARFRGVAEVQKLAPSYVEAMIKEIDGFSISV